MMFLRLVKFHDKRRYEDVIDIHISARTQGEACKLTRVTTVIKGEKLIEKARGLTLFATLWFFILPQLIQGEVRSWILGEELSWRSQQLNSTAVSFPEGAVELAGFQSQDNIFQQLRWVDGSPSTGFIPEHARANIWDNNPLRASNIPLVDGDPITSSENRFKRFGASFAGTSFFFDLGTRFPINKITFFPRLQGADEEGRPFSDDFIRAYDLLVNDGVRFNDRDAPIYDRVKRVDFTRDSVAVAEFPLQFIRFIRLNVASTSPFEIAEFQAFGTGFAPQGRYLSKIIDLGDKANFSRLNWTVEKLRLVDDEAIVVTDAEVSVAIRMRTGLDDTPLVYYQYVNLFTKERGVVSEGEYGDLDIVQRGPIAEDQDNWSEWSSPFEIAGQAINLPSPRRYFQFEVAMDSDEILEGIRVKTLSVEHSIPPLAQQVIGEISQLEDPQPLGNTPVVPAGLLSTFVYDIAADVQDGDVGFDAIRIKTPARPEFREFSIGNPPTVVVPDSIAEESGSLTLFFPSQRAVSRASGIMRVVFDAEVFVSGTFFDAEVLDYQSAEAPQVVLPGDANPVVLTNTLRVLTSAESSRDILPLVQIEPRIFSPNGDGVNDRAGISYTLVQLVRPVGVKVGIFDLSGRRVRSLFAGEAGSGAYDLSWDGRREDGTLLPIGIYLVRVEADTERDNFVRLGSVAVIY
jgi:hypothetical protein